MTLILVGAGGSILAIPTLVLIFKIPFMLSTTYSLFIVGVSASLGIFQHKNFIDFKKSFLIAIPSLIGVSFTRTYIVNFLPEKLFDFSLDRILFFILVLIMLFSSYFLLRSESTAMEVKKTNGFTIIKLVLISLIVGALIGLLGIGGGILIVPTLVLLLGYKLKNAVATSLFIVFLNSVLGFTIDKNQLNLDNYKMLISFTAVTLLGMGIGAYVNSKIFSNHLKRYFGWFIACVAVLITINEFYI